MGKGPPIEGDSHPIEQYEELTLIHIHDNDGDGDIMRIISEDFQLRGVQFVNILEMSSVNGGLTDRRCFGGLIVNGKQQLNKHLAFSSLRSAAV